MSDDIEKAILRRIDRPGWVTTRGVLLDPTGQMSEQEHRQVEEAMKRLADQGLVRLWKLVLQNGGEDLMAAARPDLELDRDLEERGAMARAERIAPGT